MAVIALATWLSIQQWRRSGATKPVLGLEILRWLIVAMLFVTLGRPELVHTIQPAETPSVVVLADASRSMTTRDVVTGDKSVVTRAEWIARQQEQGAWQPLAAKYNLVVEEFSPIPGTNDASAANPATNTVSKTPVEEGTDINAALEEVRARHKNMRAVVVLSDGDANMGRSAVGAATTHYTITNMPISRFLEFLVDSRNYDQYMTRLANAFNPAAAAGVMCRHTLSVGWDGRLYDCDFNQMLELPIDHGAPSHIRDFDPGQLHQRRIVTKNHFYGCTAGIGSSCGGAVT